jgi:TatD DNase family protein
VIIDSHAHLDMSQFDADRDRVLQRARDAGLDLVLSIATGNSENKSVEETLALAEEHDFIYASIGVHPHDASKVDDTYWTRMQKWATHPKVVLWGEIGLDYYYDLSPRAIQQEVFRRQLQMARHLGFPVSIHCREAWADLIQIVSQEFKGDHPGGVFHSFTGSKDQALQCTGMGFLVSFSGIVTFKNAESLREAARALSPDQFLVETDSPYLAPVPHRGKRNEPSFVVDIARSLAQTTGVEFGELARRTTANMLRLIGLENDFRSRLKSLPGGKSAMASDDVSC